MSYWNSSVALAARNVARKLGLVPILSRVLLGRNYEEAFDGAMVASIRPGDTIWDIGANVGLYTTKFASLTGPDGRVIAFEPSPLNYRRVSQAVADLPNVTCHRLALGSEAGSLAFVEGEDDLGAVSRVALKGDTPDVEVEVTTGDAVIAKGLAPAPTLLKLDVEGFELDVLKGLSATLASGLIRCLCIEVHFGLLRARGLPDGPQVIEKLLAGNGYEVVWTDPSHIVATRRSHA